MFFGSLRLVNRPVSRTILSSQSLFKFPITSSPLLAREHDVCHHLRPFVGNVGGIPASNADFHSDSLSVRPAGTARGMHVMNRMKQHSAITIVVSEIKKLQALVEKANMKEREKWDEERIENFLSNYLAKKKQQKEERKEAKRMEEFQIGGRKWHKLLEYWESEGKKKGGPKGTAMTWDSWITSGGVKEAKRKVNSRRRRGRR